MWTAIESRPVWGRHSSCLWLYLPQCTALPSLISLLTSSFGQIDISRLQESRLKCFTAKFTAVKLDRLAGRQADYLTDIVFQEDRCRVTAVVGIAGATATAATRVASAAADVQRKQKAPCCDARTWKRADFRMRHINRNGGTAWGDVLSYFVAHGIARAGNDICLCERCR